MEPQDFVLIIFLYNYLVSLIPDTNYTNYHGSIFVYVLPLFFFSFLAWDILRFFEYKNVDKGQKKEVKKDKEQRVSRIIVTTTFLAIIMIQAGLYAFVLPEYPLSAGDTVISNFVFIGITLAIMIGYRLFTNEPILRFHRGRGHRGK